MTEDELIVPQKVGFVDNLGSETFGEKSETHNHVIGRNIGNRYRKEVDSVNAAIESQVHDAILTAIDNVVTPSVEMAVRLIIRSTRHRPNTVVQNLDQRDF